MSDPLTESYEVRFDNKELHCMDTIITCIDRHLHGDMPAQARVVDWLHSVFLERNARNNQEVRGD